jgi:hypothetical protein
MAVKVENGNCRHGLRHEITTVAASWPYEIARLQPSRLWIRREPCREGNGGMVGRGGATGPNRMQWARLAQKRYRRGATGHPGGRRLERLSRATALIGAGVEFAPAHRYVSPTKFSS